MTAAEVARLRAPVQVHSGKADREVPVAAVERLEGMLKRQATPVEVFLYEGAGHGFLAYMRPTYDPAAAQRAWPRVTKLLARHLKEAPTPPAQKHLP